MSGHDNDESPQNEIDISPAAVRLHPAGTDPDAGARNNGTGSGFVKNLPQHQDKKVLS
jgi:hypothetical protein